MRLLDLLALALMVVFLVMLLLAAALRRSRKSDSGLPGAEQTAAQPDSPSAFTLAGTAAIAAMLTSAAFMAAETLAGKYGGISLTALVCLGLPSGVAGLLAGLLIVKLRNKTEYGLRDHAALAAVGFAIGMFLYIFITNLPQ